MIDIHLGQRIKNLVEAKGLKHKDVAEQIGTTAQYMSRLYKQEHLNSETIIKVAHILHISISELFGEVIQSDKNLKPKVEFELDPDDVLRLDIHSKKLQILKR